MARVGDEQATGGVLKYPIRRLLVQRIGHQLDVGPFAENPLTALTHAVLFEVPV